MSKEMRKYIDSFKFIILKENVTPEYDEILDLYNEVGLEGMSKDEIDFLKSGGQSRLPNRLQIRKMADKHIESTKDHEDKQRSVAGMASSLSGTESEPIIPKKDEQSYIQIEKLKEFLKKNPGYRFDYPYEGMGWGLGTFFQILFKDITLFDELIDIFYGSKSNYENEKDKYLFNTVEIRTEKHWSPENNEYRGEHNPPPSSEYKIAITIPKNWFVDLYGDYLK